MGEPVRQVISGIEVAKDNLIVLAGHLQQLKELAQSAYLEDARSNAEGNDPDAVQAYKEALELIYGIRIDDSEIPVSYDALWNYHQALEQFADFLELVTFADDMDMYDKYRLFLETMGGLTIDRIQANQIPPEHRENALWCVEIDANGIEHSRGGCTDECVDVIVDGSVQMIRRCKAPRAFTAGHIIYDISGPIYWKHENGSLVSDDARGSYRNEMTVNNTTHELFHSLNSSSGFGRLGWSPLSLRSDIKGCMETIFEGSSLVRENEEDSSTEVFADFGLNTLINTALLSNECNGLSFNEIWSSTILQAQLYHTPLTERQTQLGVIAIEGTITGDSVGFRILPNADPSQPSPITRFSAGTTVTILGYTDTNGGWYYAYRPNSSYHQYGWISANYVSLSGDANLLPCLSVSSTPEVIDCP